MQILVTAFRQPPSFHIVSFRKLHYTSFIQSVAFQQQSLHFYRHTSSSPKPSHKPNEGSCKPTRQNTTSPYLVKLTLREIIKNKYYTKLRPAKKNKINRTNQVGSTVTHHLTFFYFLLTVVKSLSVKNKNKASAKILNSSDKVFIWFFIWT